jgi:rubrerythrin
MAGRENALASLSGVAQRWLILSGGVFMAVFTCEKCGEKVETRCKPKKCPSCSESGTMCKAEAPAPKKAPKK